MVLDSQGQVLSEHEVPELLSYLPDFSGDRVLELGAGIGLVIIVPMFKSIEHRIK